ncbi:hypothetical protein D6810_03355 [Candidatus Dojkabacteria bacterium]|uniref:Uncharacterized protein n=1 Tax=Candidatus Dojkabacteria bacterium TaxID=2099670 RepID=A0A3M0YX90_9BACT|nr:MAG: hypothetical protein D6810_03355 [Candidatus Dojkabacteria bacterium]
MEHFPEQSSPIERSVETKNKKESEDQFKLEGFVSLLGALGLLRGLGANFQGTLGSVESISDLEELIKGELRNELNLPNRGVRVQFELTCGGDPLAVKLISIYCSVKGVSPNFTLKGLYELYLKNEEEFKELVNLISETWWFIAERLNDLYEYIAQIPTYADRGYPGVEMTQDILNQLKTLNGDGGNEKLKGQKNKLEYLRGLFTEIQLLYNERRNLWNTLLIQFSESDVYKKLEDFFNRIQVQVGNDVIRGGFFGRIRWSLKRGMFTFKKPLPEEIKEVLVFSYFFLIQRCVDIICRYEQIQFGYGNRVFKPSDVSTTNRVDRSLFYSSFEKPRKPYELFAPIVPITNLFDKLGEIAGLDTYEELAGTRKLRIPICKGDESSPYMYVSSLLLKEGSVSTSPTFSILIIADPLTLLSELRIRRGKGVTGSDEQLGALEQ